jgi:hypothetical protein
MTELSGKHRRYEVKLESAYCTSAKIVEILPVFVLILMPVQKQILITQSPSLQKDRKEIL